MLLGWVWLDPRFSVKMRCVDYKKKIMEILILDHDAETPVQYRHVHFNGIKIIKIH